MPQTVTGANISTLTRSVVSTVGRGSIAVTATPNNDGIVVTAMKDIAQVWGSPEKVVRADVMGPIRVASPQIARRS
jgi:hypothetical protein